MKKKVLAIMLSLVMVFTLAACGNGGNGGRTLRKRYFPGDCCRLSAAVCSCEHTQSGFVFHPHCTESERVRGLLPPQCLDARKEVRGVKRRTKRLHNGITSVLRAASPSRPRTAG